MGLSWCARRGPRNKTSRKFKFSNMLDFAVCTRCMPSRRLRQLNKPLGFTEASVFEHIDNNYIPLPGLETDHVHLCIMHSKRRAHSEGIYYLDYGLTQATVQMHMITHLEQDTTHAGKMI